MSDLTNSIANDCLKNGKNSSSEQELQSLTQLVDLPEELHRTLFKMIDKKQMKKMLPPSLKVSEVDSLVPQNAPQERIRLFEIKLFPRKGKRIGREGKPRIFRVPRDKKKTLTI